MSYHMEFFARSAEQAIEIVEKHAKELPFVVAQHLREALQHIEKGVAVRVRAVGHLAYPGSYSATSNRSPRVRNELIVEPIRFQEENS